MADQIRALIDKINQEGVQAAEEKARQIETEAQAKAAAIVLRANTEAKKILEEAREKVSRMEASSQASLKQAGRDLLLVLKKEVLELLAKIIAADVGNAISEEELTKILTELIKQYAAQQTSAVTVYLSEQDKKKLEGRFISRLKEETKKGVELKSREDIRSGFVISFDAGRSQFDFSDAALAEYIGSSLKPSVAELLGGKA